jgi:hypothetical protein
VDDLFISYKREERDTARQLADGLESRGWSVWWDPKLQAGERFDDVIERAIKNVKCVIVLWSRRSITSTYVKDEASCALEAEKLVPVALDDAKPPFRFQGLHTIQLQGWDGSARFPAFQELIRDIEAKAGRPTTGKQTILDLLKPPEPTSISVDEIIEPRALMELHYALMTRKDPLLEDALLVSRGKPKYPPLRAATSGFGLSANPAYGRITRAELAGLEERLHDDARRKSMGDHRINRELEQVRKVLGKIDSKGAEAVDYMPVQLKKLPAHLKKCAVEILLNNTLAGSFGQPFEISPNSLSMYRFRHDSPEESYFIDQIAQHLGWQS